MWASRNSSRTDAKRGTIQAALSSFIKQPGGAQTFGHANFCTQIAWDSVHSCGGKGEDPTDREEKRGEAGCRGSRFSSNR